MITRDETPFMSSIGKTKATAIYHEWQTDELNAPGNSRIGEGTDYLIPGATSGPIAGGTDANSGFWNCSKHTENPTTVGAGTFNIVGPNRTKTW